MLSSVYRGGATLARKGVSSALQQIAATMPPSMSTDATHSHTPYTSEPHVSATIGYVGKAESETTPTVVFVLGGPGAGKGTQCARLVNDFGFEHLSAGELLRQHMQSGSDEGRRVAEILDRGEIVPSHITISLLLEEMQRRRQQEGGCSNRFLIDGFPRNKENRDAWEKQAGYDCQFVLFFDCQQETLEQRLSSRNQGRSDDNTDTIRSRFKVFLENTMPIIRHYEGKGKVAHVRAEGTPDEVYQRTCPFFEPFLKARVLELTRLLLRSIDSGDYETYQKLCDESLTSFEPEAKGALVQGLPFHKFYFDAAQTRNAHAAREAGAPWVHSDISSPTVRLLGNDAAVVTYTRMCQRMVLQPPSGRETQMQSDGFAPPGTTFHLPKTEVFEETRVWHKQAGGQWKNVHFHRSRPSE